MIIAKFKRRSLIRESKVFIKDKTKVASVLRDCVITGAGS